MNIIQYEPKNVSALEVRKFMIKIIQEDFGYEFNPKWHADINDLSSTYYYNRNNVYIIIFVLLTRPSILTII